jgi:hypothetical protein
MLLSIRSPLKRRWLWLVMAAMIAIILWPTPRPASTVVTLIYFHANWRADVETVVLTWATASELDTAGFQIERSTSQGSGFAPINGGEVIAAEGNQLTGAEYGPIGDDDPPPIGTTYWYRLVEITLNNQRNPSMPVAVLIGTEATVTPTPMTVWPWAYLPMVLH